MLSSSKVFLGLSTVVVGVSLSQAAVSYPPRLPGGKPVLTLTSRQFLKPPPALKSVGVAKTAPTVDFLYYPGQTYPGKPWSNWGDGLAVNGKYYSAIGDHKGPDGNAFVYEYDAGTKRLPARRPAAGAEAARGPLHARQDPQPH